MNLYLASFTGTGIKEDPFRPVGVDGIGMSWSCVDLRADPKLLVGFGLLATDGTVVHAGARLLSTGRDRLISAANLTAIETALGISLTGATRTDGVIARIMFVDHGVGKWSPARPERDGKIRVHINSIVWAEL